MVDSYTAVSEAVRQEAIHRAGIAPEKIITIANGVDCADLPAAPAISETGGAFTVALPGRFHRQKGHAVLLEALKLVDGQQPEIQAFLFGEGPDEAALKKMAFELGVQNRVRFMGVVTNGADAMRTMDAVIMPSLWEGMPNAVLEAMALGKPVIASRIPGMDELVEDGRTGLLFTPGNAAELARAMLALARDRKRARAMGADARVLVNQSFSLHTTVAATEALYDRLLGRPTGAKES
jgi:glycosyltransferase involved in cell wall biosynthesis